MHVTHGFRTFGATGLAKQKKRKQQLEAPGPEMLKQAIGKLSVRSLSGIRCGREDLGGAGACLCLLLCGWPGSCENGPWRPKGLKSSKEASVRHR